MEPTIARQIANANRRDELLCARQSLADARRAMHEAEANDEVTVSHLDDLRAAETEVERAESAYRESSRRSNRARGLS